jgi:hypothetical protein
MYMRYSGGGVGHASLDLNEDDTWEDVSGEDDREIGQDDSMKQGASPNRSGDLALESDDGDEAGESDNDDSGSDLGPDDGEGDDGDDDIDW